MSSGSPGMALRTNGAAVLLGVSANTLRSWERRFGYPLPMRTEGGHRQYDLHEIETLRQAFEETHNVSSAISIARERGRAIGSPTRLRQALGSYDQQACDRVLEESLAVRSVERTVETLLLPAIESLSLSEHDAAGPEYAFAWRYAAGWLASTRRVAPSPSRPERIVLFDATNSLDLDSLHLQALELYLRRLGVEVLCLPAGLEPARVSDALAILHPHAVVLCGRRASLDRLARLVYAVRRVSETVRIFGFRGALGQDGVSIEHLAPDATSASAALRERLMVDLAARSRAHAATSVSAA